MKSSVEVCAVLLLCLFSIDLVRCGEVDVDAGRKLAQKTINLIYQRFEFWNVDRYPFFLYSMNFPSWTWDVLKYKVALKALLPDGAKPEPGSGANMDPDKGKTTNSSSSNYQKEFMMIFGGSSVTAGHDNFFNESYPIVFKRRLQDVLTAIDIPIVVRNIAQGANNCFPSNFCYESMGDVPADWIGWEQSYNCGKAHNVFEQMARTCGWNDAILHFSASGAFKPDECEKQPINNSTGEPKMAWIREEWTPEREGLKEGEPIPHDYPNGKGYSDGDAKPTPNLVGGGHMPHIYSAYLPNAKQVEEHKKLLHDGYMVANPVGRFTGMMWPHYNGAGPHGFSVWTKGDRGDALPFRGPCYNEGGSHWMTHETAEFTKGGGASWHPPAGMHLLRGELLAYNYLHVLIDAMNMLEKDMADPKLIDDSKQGKDKYAKLRNNYSTKLKELQIPMPDKPMRCSPECASRPLCYTNYEPHFREDQRLNQRIVGSHPGWVYARKKGGPGSDNMHNGVDYGYLDKRPCYESRGVSNSALSLKIEIRNKDQNFISICAYDHKEGLRHAHFYLDEGKDPPIATSSVLESQNGPAEGEFGRKRHHKHKRRLSRRQLESIFLGDTPSPSTLAPSPSPAPTTDCPHPVPDEVPDEPEPSTAAADGGYVLPPLDKLKRLVNRKYINDECHRIEGLPVGKHVLTVMTHADDKHEEHKDHMYSVSHIIEWS